MSKNKKKPDELEVVDIHNCARCGLEHEGLVFRPFKGATVQVELIELTHFAICPTLGEPILLRVEDETSS